MEIEKKHSLRRAILSMIIVLILGYFRLNRYLSEGDITVWVAYILIAIGIGFLAYFSTRFKLKDEKRSRELNAEEYFEMHKRRIKYVLIFCFIMLIVFLAVCDLLFEYLDISFLLIMVFIYILIVSILIISWYTGVKKIVREKEQSNSFEKN